MERELLDVVTNVTRAHADMATAFSVAANAISGATAANSNIVRAVSPLLPQREQPRVEHFKYKPPMNLAVWINNTIGCPLNCGRGPYSRRGNKMNYLFTELH